MKARKRVVGSARRAYHSLSLFTSREKGWSDVLQYSIVVLLVVVAVAVACTL